MFNFLIDTADEKYIREKWELLKKYIPKENVVGITTNPNAFYKINMFSLEEWLSTTKRLANLVEEIRQDKLGELHIQFPNSNLSKHLFLKWLDILESQNISNVKLFVKVPPFQDGLNIVQKNNKNRVSINVTGVADGGTALNALSYNISYLSIIPGRMEEMGIDAKKHVAYVQSRKKDRKKIITGSMRTLECLKWCVEMGTVPTIGTRVFDLMDEESLKQIVKWKKKKISDITKFCPVIEQKNTDLSVSFFKQMDEMGSKCYEGLK